MLSEKNKNQPVSTLELRKFGLTLAIALSVWGGIFLWHAKTGFPVFFILAAVIFVCSLIKPLLLMPLRKMVVKLAEIIGMIITHFVLGVVFYILFTLIGVIGRLFGKQFLDTNFNDRKDSYWKLRKSKQVKPESYEKQF